MINKLKIIILIIILFPSPLFSYSQGNRVLFREDFNNLDNWKPLYFPKIKRHTIYAVETDGEDRYLRAESNASASALIYKHEFNVSEFSNIRWRWKVENIYKKGDVRTKEGDDYPIRVYIAFKYDPEKAGLAERLKYKTARLLYGEYPPHSSLNYIWSSKEEKERIIVSPYTNRSMMVILQQGSEKVGKWEREVVNIIEDYVSAFGNEPPATATIAIMSDSDNTGEKAISYVDDLEVYR